jgi:hypothetical protein
MENGMNEFERGVIAPADGNAAGGEYVAGNSKRGVLDDEVLRDANGASLRMTEAVAGGTRAPDLGPNLERLEEERPELVNALRELVREYRQEGVVARRHEIRRIRQARLFWQGMQYAWWNPTDMNWHLPYESRSNDSRELEEMPRYQFVTNFYQGFGLSFVAVLSQDVPSVRFYPQSAQSLVDIAAARAASDVAELIERNNHVEHLLTVIGYFLWTDGKLGAYVRYVEDRQRFGFREEEILEAIEVPLGPDVWVCPECGKETAVGHDQEVGEAVAGLPGSLRSEPQNARLSGRDDNDLMSGSQDEVGEERPASEGGPYKDRALVGASAAVCPGCGAELGEKDLKRAERVLVPRVAAVRRVANGQEVISVAGGLELNTPVWANEMHEYPYLQWQTEVHRAKLKAAYPLAASKIESAPSQGAEDVYARVSRLSVEQGLPTVHPGDALMNLITFDRTWLRPWAFYSVEDETVRGDLLALFPDGCYVAFAGDVYCEARNEGMDDHWRVLHALPGDGQNRPSVGDSLVQVQERYNALSNIQAETYEYGIPPIYADPQVLDFDAIGNQVAEPAAHFPARARPGQPLAAGFFQPAPAQVPPDMIRHQQDLIGPVAQFLTGLFPAVFGGNMEDVKTASGYAMARDQAMGRLGLVWRRLKQFYADVMLLAVDCFRKNRPEDVDVPLLGPDGMLDAKMIRVADLKGNICVHPEADETFPRLKSQQRGVLQQLFGLKDPVIQEALAEPANLGYIKSVLGLTELVVPGEDARNKQLREIQVLLSGAPIVVDVAPDPRTVTREETPGASTEGTRDTEHETRSVVLPSVTVDVLLDDHAVEFEECKRWANSEAGQAAKMTNPAGFANVRAHAEAHLRALRPPEPTPNAAPLSRRPQMAGSRRLSQPPPPPALHPGVDRDSPGDHWVTINGNHVLIHEPQGTHRDTRQQSNTPGPFHPSITYRKGLSPDDQALAREKIEAAIALINSKWAQLTDEEKSILQHIESIEADPEAVRPFVSEDIRKLTLNPDFVRDSSIPWIASSIVHDGYHVIQWKLGGVQNSRGTQAEVPAMRIQLEAGKKLGLTDVEKKRLREFIQNPALLEKYVHTPPH